MMEVLGQVLRRRVQHRRLEDRAHRPNSTSEKGLHLARQLD
jgi:hypothetical protein